MNQMTEPTSIRLLIVALIVGTLVGLVAISDASFWIDEGGTGLTSIQPTLSTWWGSMRWERNSNMQLPLYLLILWIWGQVFGQGEWALRMFNLPCFLLSIVAMWLAYRDDRRVFTFSFVFLCSSAFIWFYLDQARPYTFFLAGSMLLLGAVYRFWHNKEWNSRWAWWLTFASLMVSGTSIIGLEWVVLTTIAIWYLGGRAFPLNFSRSFPVQVTLLCLGVAVLGAYYLWSLSVGSDVPKYGRNGVLMNIAFMTYEYLGFAGLGPNRNAMRLAPIEALTQHAIPITLFGFLLTALIVYGRNRGKGAREPQSMVFYALLLLPAPIVILAGEIRNIRVLPRHMTPLMPVVILLMGFVLQRCWYRSRLGKLLAFAFLLASTISAWQLRFSPRHARDDYRYAASLAGSEIAKGNQVLWVADPQTAMYYGLLRPEDWDGGGTKALLLAERGVARLSKTHSIVLYSKPDLYDKQGRIRAFLRTNNYSLIEQFQAFELWRSPS